MQWGCHRLPERSFFFRGQQFPVCARCTGVIIGQYFTFVLINIVLLLGISIEEKILLLYLSFFLILPMLTDWALQNYFSIISNNMRRLITGFFCGIGAAYIYLFTLYFIFEHAILKYFK